MNVSLTPELEQFVQDRLDSGLYHTASEVVREGLRLLKERDELHAQRVAKVRAKIQRGVAQLKRGEGVDGETVLEALKARTAALRRRRA